MTHRTRRAAAITAYLAILAGATAWAAWGWHHALTPDDAPKSATTGGPDPDDPMPPPPGIGNRRER